MEIKIFQLADKIIYLWSKLLRLCTIKKDVLTKKHISWDKLYMHEDLRSKTDILCSTKEPPKVVKPLSDILSKNESSNNYLITSSYIYIKRHIPSVSPVSS